MVPCSLLLLGYVAHAGEEVFGSVRLGTVPCQTKSLLPNDGILGVV